MQVCADTHNALAGLDHRLGDDARGYCKNPKCGHPVGNHTSCSFRLVLSRRYLLGSDETGADVFMAMMASLERRVHQMEVSRPRKFSRSGNSLTSGGGPNTKWQSIPE